MASSNPLPSFKRQAAANTSIAELQRLAGITVASMEAVRRDDVEGPGRSDLLTRGVSGPMRSDLLTELRMTEGASRRDPFEPPDDEAYSHYYFTFDSKEDAAKGFKILYDTLVGHASDPEEEDGEWTITGVGTGDNGADAELYLKRAGIQFKSSETAMRDSEVKDYFAREGEPPEEARGSMRRLAHLQERAAASRTGASRAYDLGRDTADAHSDDWTSGSFSQGDLRRTAEEQSDEEIQHGNITRAEKKQFIAGYIDGVNTAHGEKTGAVTERATRKTADPKWMTMAVRIADIYNEVTDEIGLEGAPPKGDAATAVSVFFTYKVEKELGNSIPIEVYYELEDANYHTANEFLDKMGLFDAPYGTRQDDWTRDRQGLKPMWDR